MSSPGVVAERSFGLSPHVIAAIRGVFRDYPQIDSVLIYGSRAKGNYRQGSDIDLTLTGTNLTHDLLNRIEARLDDLLLPYTFDLSLLSQIDNVELIDHIKRAGKVFYP